VDEKTIDAIHRLLQEMTETRGKLKAMNMDLKDVMEQNDDYRKIQDELKELTGKRAQAKKLLEADKDYQTIASEVEELKFKMKDLSEILSHHLVTYYDETRQTEIKDNDGEVRPVIISAKIGKPEAGIQSQS
jgi:predicted nucleotidyltransferase